jgi:hypothetical protein
MVKTVVFPMDHLPDLANLAASMQLTMEQQFNLTMYRGQAEAASPEDLREMLLEVTRQLMIKDNIIKSFLKPR